MTSSWRPEPRRFGRLAFLLILAWLAAAPAIAQRDLSGRRAAPRNAKPNPADTASKRKVEPLTLRYRPQALADGGSMTDTVRTDLRNFHYWDEADTLSGWTQSLGQVGKPVRNYRWGLPAEYFGGSGTVSHWFRRNDPYLWDIAREGPYYDSRTPFSRIDFAQARRDQQLLGATFAVNPSPFWNVGAQYRRRSAQGAYLGFITDHYQAALGQQFHSRNGRYQGFAGGAWHQLRDQINGGGRRDLDPESERAFGKGARPPALSPARPAALERRLWSFSTLHRYRLLGADTSLTNVALLAWASGERAREQYLDPTPYDAQTLRNDTLSLYPLNSWDVRYANAEGQVLLQLRRKAQALRGGAGAQVGFNFWRLRLLGHFGLEPESTVLEDSSFEKLRIDGLRQQAWLQARSQDSSLTLRAEATNRITSLWQPERRTRLAGMWQPISRHFHLVDSTAIDTGSRFFLRRTPEILQGVWRPLTVAFSIEEGEMNPPAALVLGVLPLLEGRADLLNERLSHFRASAAWEGGPKMRRGFVYKPWRVSLEGFVTELRRPLGFDAERRTIQAADGKPLRWVGATLSGRLRMGRFYLENETTVQQATDHPDGFSRYADNLPPVYGKASIYYENKIRRTGLTLYAGLECRYFGPHAAQDFDLLTGWFYPRTDRELPGYAAVDAVLAGRFLKNASVFVKFIHMNEGLNGFGYYTTPHYPMLERSFSFGVNWMFFN